MCSLAFAFLEVGTPLCLFFIAQSQLVHLGLEIRKPGGPETELPRAKCLGSKGWGVGAPKETVFEGRWPDIPALRLGHLLAVLVEHFQGFLGCRHAVGRVEARVLIVVLRPMRARARS